MRQRALSPTGDWTFGTALPLLSNSPLCVAQAVMTRLNLHTGEWFVDLDDGTPYDTQILGFDTGDTRDLAIRTRILDTPGVARISNYISFLQKTRAFNIIATVDTQFGSVDITLTPGVST